MSGVAEHLRTYPLCEAMCGLRIRVEDGRVTRFRLSGGDKTPYAFVTNAILDTGAPTTNIPEASSIAIPEDYLESGTRPNTRIAPGNIRSVVADGTEVDDAFRLDLVTGHTPGVDEITVSQDADKAMSAVNLGLVPFFRHDVIFDVERGLVGFAPSCSLRVAGAREIPRSVRALAEPPGVVERTGTAAYRVRGKPGGVHVGHRERLRDRRRDEGARLVRATAAQVRQAVAGLGDGDVSPEVFAGLLGAVGVQGTTLPARMAGINEVLNALPVAFRERLLVEYLNELYRHRGD